jgi:putative N6-adenine-specific DNA methylase
MPKQNFTMIAKTLAGLEDVLAEELIGLGADKLEIGLRMVSFEGDKKLLYKANVCCRTALRILKPLCTFRARNADDIYDAVKRFDWLSYMDAKKTFAVDSVVFSDIFSHSKFVAYRVKDGIVDFFTEKTGARPSISTANPDLQLNIHIAHDRCTLSLDSSGESLHKRGYREGQGDAPLSEVLAAGMLLKAGWRGETDFIDPFCGSGTLLIEAALIARNIPPGIYRNNFAFEKWTDFDRDLFEHIYNDDSAERKFMHKIYGSDISPKAIGIAERNVKRAGLANDIELCVKSMQQYDKAPAPAGLLVTNPPYGERIKPDDLISLYESIGERLKHVFTGYTAWILSTKKEYFHKIGLKPSKKISLMNGAIECEFRKYELFDGKRSERTKRISK